jgi:hypothetical protein
MPMMQVPSWISALRDLVNGQLLCVGWVSRKIGLEVSCLGLDRLYGYFWQPRVREMRLSQSKHALRLHKLRLSQLCTQQ